MGNIFFRICLIVSSVFMSFICRAADVNFNAQHTVIDAGAPVTPATKAQQVQALAESQTMPGDASLTKAEQFYKYGDKLFNAGDYANAVRYFYAVTKAEPKNVKAWKKVAFCYYKLNNHNYAFSAFKMVLKYDSGDKDAVEFMDYYKTIIEKNTKTQVKRDPIDSIWRASVLPGFGQIYNSQAAKGIIVGCAFIVAGGLTYYNVADEKVKYEKYKKANENQDIAFKQAQESWTAALVWGIITGAVYAGGIVDAGLNYNCDEARSAGLQIRDNAVFACAEFRW
jgi:tetratricopeptide (TPR) repeat protein